MSQEFEMCTTLTRYVIMNNINVRKIDDKRNVEGVKEIEL